MPVPVTRGISKATFALVSRLRSKAPIKFPFRCYERGPALRARASPTTFPVGRGSPGIFIEHLPPRTERREREEKEKEEGANGETEKEGGNRGRDRSLPP